MECEQRANLLELIDRAACMCSIVSTLVSSLNFRILAVVHCRIGIDYTNPVLGGGFGPGFKVVGGFDFVGDAYSKHLTP